MAPCTTISGTCHIQKWLVAHSGFPAPQHDVISYIFSTSCFVVSFIFPFSAFFLNLVTFFCLSFVFFLILVFITFFGPLLAQVPSDTPSHAPPTPSHNLYSRPRVTGHVVWILTPMLTFCAATQPHSVTVPSCSSDTVWLWGTVANVLRNYNETRLRFWDKWL